MTWWRAALCVLAIGAGTLGAPPAAAGSHHRHRRHHRARGHRDPPRRPNMPPGWKWPPSRAMKAEGRRCLDDLRELGVSFERVPRRRMIATPVVVRDMRFGELEVVSIWRKPPFVMDCVLARALARHAALLVGLGVRQLRFSSIHDVRKVRMHGMKHPPLSRHALGLAIDVYEIGVEGRAPLVVKRDYWSIDPTIMVAEQALRATGSFRAVLSPGVDPISHPDHVHLEAAVDPEDHPKRRR